MTPFRFLLWPIKLALDLGDEVSARARRLYERVERGAAFGSFESCFGESGDDDEALRPTGPRERVAVLGGGMAALTAAFELARTGHYDVTVFQQGWRLGGKGASGRNAKYHGRIEEHGLHMWFGAYTNAFALMRDVYDKQFKSEPRKWPYGDVETAFQRQPTFHLMEKVGNDWMPWEFPFPEDGETPGRLRAAHLIDAIRNWLPGHLLRSQLYQRLIKLADADAGTKSLAPTSELIISVRQQLTFLQELAGKPALNPFDTTPDGAVMEAYRAYAEWLWTLVKPKQDGHIDPQWEELGIDPHEARRLAYIADVSQAVIRGALDSGIYGSGDWNKINHLELRDWLGRYVVKAETLRSPLLQASYDLFFAFPGGMTTNKDGEFEAGTATRAALWLILGYEGAVMWRMNAGMGDTIFAPLYNVLTGLGVKFRFFSKVVELGLSPDKKRIASIKLEQQATTVTEGLESYQPFVTDRKGLDCWPSVPNFDQLKQGTALEAEWWRFNLESDCSEWKPVGSYKVDVGPGGAFDKVVLGIPVAALPGICAPLLQGPAGQAWSLMLQNVQTVQTQAFQVWLSEDLPQLGSTLGPGPPRPVLTTFSEPVDTYADMTHLLDHEDWPHPAPAHCAYFCGVMEERQYAKPPRKDHNFANQLSNEVAATAREMLRVGMRPLWPAAYKGKAGAFDWNLLCGGNAAGQQRFEKQYWRPNTDLSERYVINVPGSSTYRLKAGGAGYEDLYLAGDWIDNGLYVGCIEGAVIAGKQAAHAIVVSAMPVHGKGGLFK